MTDHLFLRAHGFFRRNRRAAMLVVGGVAAVGAVSLWWVPFDKTLQTMLPAGSSVPRMMEVLQDARFSNKVLISVEATGTAAAGEGLAAVVDGLAESLGSPLISKVTSDFSNLGSLTDIGALFQSVPQILDEEDLKMIEERLTAPGIRVELRRRYVELLKPEGSFMAGLTRSDPLAIRRILAVRLESVMSSFGYQINIEQGHLFSRDGRHALLIAETPIPPMDSARSKELTDFLAERVSRLPAGYRADLFCGHLHTVSNERVMKRDIALTNIVASIAFLGLFFVCFRDVRAVLLIFAIPVVAAIVAIPLTALFFQRVALLVVGLGSVIAGVAVDYAVHMYVTARRSGNAARDVMHIALPVSLGAFTTCGMFLAFFSSSVPGYHQLALFSILSILLSLAFALFVFPHFVKPRADHAAAPDPGSESRGSTPPRVNRLIVWGWVLCVAVAAFAARGVRFDSNIQRLDGTERTILQAEERIRKIWGQGEGGQAILVATAPTEEAALRLSDLAYGDMRRRLPGTPVATLSAIWPSRETREQNAARWTALWLKQLAAVKRITELQGKEFGFAAGAFEPFYNQIATGVVVTAESPANAILERLKEQFVQRKSGAWQVLSFYPDSPECARALAKLVEQLPGLFLVSPRVLAGEMSGVYSREILRVSAVAVLIILAVTFLMVRSVRITFVSLVPSATAVVVLLAAMALGGWKLNMANLIAGIVVFGLSLDYGFVMMHSYRHRLAAETTQSVHISAITTIIGTAALLFAKHPALFSIGFTLTIGILAGYVVAMWVVPALYSLLVARK